MTAAPMIEVADLHKHFGALHVLRGIDLSVARGRGGVHHRPVRLAASRTLLRCLNQLEVAERGRIRIDGELIAYRDEIGGALRPLANRAVGARCARSIGMVFQQLQPVPAS